ncbi:MAG: alpha/beta fold hydrolase [Candidatus Melainabacteria bacterium]|nr:MAG: alpha/beta fold hydrolase [Candidatus Melainabacteria bacterium]
MKNTTVSSLLILLLALGLNQAPALAGTKHAVEAKAALLCIPGLTQHSSTYERLACQMAAYGITTTSLDVQGFQAPEPGSKQDLIDFDQTVEQVRLAAQTYKRNHPNLPVFVLGESTGGTIALKLAAKYPDCVDGILCSSPTWKVNGRNKIAFLEFLDLTVLRTRRQGLAVNYVIRRTTVNKDIQARMLREEGRRQRFSIWESLKFMHFINTSPRTALQIKTTPVFIVQGLNDQLGKTKWSAMLFNKISGSKKTLLLDANAEHLICEEGQCSEDIVEAMKNWMMKNSSGEAAAHPEGIFLSSDGLSKKEKHATKELFKLAGVMP